MNREAFLILVSLLAVLLFSCAYDLAGNGGEITNGICVAEAMPAQNAMVVAYRQDYIPTYPLIPPETTFTDSNGHFSMRLGNKGWNLIIYDRNQIRGAFIALPTGDSALDTINLHGLGSITGIINDSVGVSKYIGIVGSPFFTQTFGKTDTFSLKKLPPFNYSVNSWYLSSTGNYFTNTDSIDANPQPIITFPLILVTVLPDSATTVTIGP
jgi:hypothetical protein